MSRTFRKRYDKCWVDKCTPRDNWVQEYIEYYAKRQSITTEKYKEQERKRYLTRSSKWYTYKLPKNFRNSVNRSRRRYDKAELWKVLNMEHEGQFCKWNCKTSNAWGYW